MNNLRFYNRERELTALQRATELESSAMIVVSGRRRVGKSRLVDEFLKKNKGLKVIVVPKEEKQAAADFAEVFSEEYKPSFNSVKNGLEYFFTQAKQRTLYIDEFPNYLEVNPSIPYELQRLWEIYKEKTNKIIILSGSYVSMMDKIFTRQKAPLFNRATSKIILQPLGLEVVWNIESDLGIASAEEQIANYCIFGGIPYYYELLAKYNPPPPVENLFFGVGELKEEGQDILRQEFGAKYKKYFSILEAIGNGLASGSEIANKMGIAQTTLSKYLISLQNDFKLVQRIVPFGQNQYRSKKGVYLLKDNLLAFWFSHVYGKTQPPSQSDLNMFVSKRFELLCLDFILKFFENKGEKIVKTGKWWGSVEVEKGKFEQREIDLIIETEKNLYVGECKWSNNTIGEKELNYLKQSAKALKTKKQIKWILFNKKGFTLKQNPEVLLFNAEKIAQNQKTTNNFKK